MSPPCYDSLSSPEPVLEAVRSPSWRSMPPLPRRAGAWGGGSLLQGPCPHPADKATCSLWLGSCAGQGPDKHLEFVRRFC